MAGSRSWQSASLPGRLATSSAPLAAGQFAGLARRLAGLGRLDHLGGDGAGVLRVLLQPGAEHVVDEALHHRADLGRDELVLGLRGELRVRHLHGEEAGEALAAVVARKVDFLAFQEAGAVGVAGHLPGQRTAEAGEVRAAVALGMLLVKASTFSW